jgi:hypothetical protein
MTRIQESEGTLTRLRWANQALARPAEEQLALHPDFICKADELVLEVDEYARPLPARASPLLSAKGKCPFSV